MIVDLKDLVAPRAKSDFLAAFAEKVPLHISAADPGRAEYLLPWSSVNALLAAGVPGPDPFRVIRDGTDIPRAFYMTKSKHPDIDPAALRRVLMQGASLVIHDVGTLVPQIGDLEQAIERETGCLTWVNAYLTFQKGGALKPHFDDHDVLVLQVRGRKLWSLYGETTPYPLRGPGPGERCPAELKQEVMLLPGDMLFVPRGHWHKAAVEDDEAVHLAFGMKGVTGVELVGEFAKRLEADSLFRRYVALDDRAAAAKALKDRLHATIDDLSFEAVLERLDAERLARGVSRLGRTAALGDSVVLRSALRRPFAGTAGCDGTILLGGIVHKLSDGALAALRWIDAQSRTTFGDLAARIAAQGDGGSAHDAVNELAERGLIFIDD